MQLHKILKKDVLDLQSAKMTATHFSNLMGNIGRSIEVYKWNGSSFDSAVVTTGILSDDEDTQEFSTGIEYNKKFELILSTKTLIDAGISTIDEKDKCKINGKEFYFVPGSVFYYGNTDLDIGTIDKSIVVSATVVQVDEFRRRSRLR